MRILVFSLFVLIAPLALGQSKKEVKKADRLFKLEMYEQALPMFKKFINMDPSNVDFVYKYGSCVLMVTDQTTMAMKLLLKAEEMGKKDQEIAYFIGRAYEREAEYEKAITYYERFITVTEKEVAKNLRIKKRIKSCKKAARSK